MADWKEILYDDEPQLSEEEILRYLADHTTDEEKERIQQKASENSFEYDALQGLSSVDDKKNLTKHIGQLNGKLRLLTAKKSRKYKEKIRIYEWVILAILLLLFICIMGFILVSLHTPIYFHSK